MTTSCSEVGCRFVSFGKHAKTATKPNENSLETFETTREMDFKSVLGGKKGSEDKARSGKIITPSSSSVLHTKWHFRIRDRKTPHACIDRVKFAISNRNSRSRKTGKIN